MKNNCSLFERFFLKNENDIFLFEISIFRDIDVFLLCKLGK